jgi:hypothetical protein
MKLLSVNVGLPREVEWKGKLVRTSIFKAPVAGRVRVAQLNLEGDQQSDLSGATLMSFALRRPCAEASRRYRSGRLFHQAV